MKIYLAGTPGTREREKQWLNLYENRLLSYWDISQQAFSVYEAFLLIKRKNNENIRSGSSGRRNHRRL